MDPVVLIADAGPDAGLGHLARTAALGAALRKRRVPVAAFGLGLPRPAQRSGVSFSPASADRHPPASAIVLDSYLANRTLRRSLRALAPLAVFTDESRPPQEADLCISSSYLSGWRCLSGPAFACLGPSYWSCIERFPAPEVQRVLVTTGARDVCNVGERVAGGLRDALPDVTVALVRGPFSRQAAPQGVELVSAPSTLHAELDRADLVVCTAGQTMLESLATGAPTVALAVASTQRRQLNRLRRARAVVAAMTPEDAVSRAVTLAGDLDARRALSRTAHATVDGRGAFRVADGVLALCRDAGTEREIRVRPVTKEATAALLGCRHDALTRRLSFTRNEIKTDGRAWLRPRAADPNTLSWIAFCDEKAIGQLRLTQSGNEAEIHVTLAPEHRGRRLARPMIEEGVSAAARAWPAVHRVLARIDPHSVGPRRAFMAAGFTPAQPADDWLLLELVIRR